MALQCQSLLQLMPVGTCRVLPCRRLAGLPCRQRGSQSRQLAPARCASLGFGGFGSKAKAKAKPKKGAAKEEEQPLWVRDRKKCPCGSGKNYEDCCEEYHRGEVAPTAEALMRARFSAYVKGQVDYVCDTTHPNNPAAEGSKRPDGTPASTLREDVVATMDKCAFQRMKVLEARPGANDDEAFVSFIVTYKIVGQKGQLQKGSKVEAMTERARFIREDGRWRYIDGDADWDIYSERQQGQQLTVPQGPGSQKKVNIYS